MFNVFLFENIGIFLKYIFLRGGSFYNICLKCVLFLIYWVVGVLLFVMELMWCLGF